MINFTVLIPSYNEEKTIGGIVRTLKKTGLIVYVVDDGSTDNTSDEAVRAGAVVLKTRRNGGKGAALRMGFHHILKKDFEAVLVMDGDGQHRPEDIEKFSKKMEETGAGLVIGSRMSNTSSMPKIRVWTNRFMSGLISSLAGQYIPDSQSGFRMAKTGLLRRVKLTSSRFEIESELIIKASRAGFRIESVPVETVYEGKKSYINPIIDTLRFLWFLAGIMAKR